MAHFYGALNLLFLTSGRILMLKNHENTYICVKEGISSVREHPCHFPSLFFAKRDAAHQRAIMKFSVFIIGGKTW